MSCVSTSSSRPMAANWRQINSHPLTFLRLRHTKAPWECNCQSRCESCS